MYWRTGPCITQVVLWALLLGMAIRCGSDAPATLHAQSTTLSRRLGTGRMLIAQRSLGDPNFAETVVLLSHYSETGAMGLIVNRPLKISLSRVLKGMAWARDRNDPAYEGGPVERGGVLALVRSQEKVEDARAVLEDVYLVNSQPVLEKVGAGPGAASLRIYLGYAGWGPGQLEGELRRGAWHVLPGASDIVFDLSPDTLWKRMIQRSEARLASAAPRLAWTAAELQHAQIRTGHLARF